ncbi:MAG: Asp-tRNA(Asn)/Glu-tRNA(Gln) amidotransferase subunit GatB [Candidatus Pacebacteria bacterium]|nr:Asp-tRNA(Asn)/Glu-tRNA(Gln) amidotransferase subunit GatB [Candidatus Paceibacterota bacterium]MCF7856969.1 Asp-tRNA(Asn)/Glu-tRNA(Gln) amidotransferase subunit GatB [Candidatus Paceibacterota bacterium]
MKTYTPTIGIEVHAELKTKTKMFCNSKNEPTALEPNSHVCPVCMGHPGTLPVINRTAVEHVLKVGLALKSELATYTEFDRKNYFYPDIPKGYQISQYLYPLVKGGVLHGVDITRVHLEEDTARSLHDQGDGSVIDYNRAGVPLMELVTEPVIHDAKTAGDFARELQLLLRTIGVSDANMEKGEMRVEANISVSDTDTFGTKVEVKNLNSFKSVESAIEFEIKRQSALLDEGGTVVQETRGWDEAKGKTYSQRVKESAHDYRYFPDPDLPKLNMQLSDSFSLSRLEEEMPMLPNNKRLKYSELGLTIEQSELIISNIEIDNFFREVLQEFANDPSLSKLAANYITSDVLSLLSENKRIDTSYPKQFATLITMINNAEISSRVAKDLLSEVLFSQVDPKKLASEKGLLQASSDDDLLPIVALVIEQNEQVVSEYRGGKESALQFLVGQGMKISKGSANPTALIKLFKREIN